MFQRKFYAVILAGGNGERFWPLSTPKRPKQFLKIFGGMSLLRQAAIRLHGLADPEHVIVITSSQLVAATRGELPELPRENIIAEPCRRDTAAAVAVACGRVRRLGGEDAVGVILTADQLMDRPATFRRILKDAVRAAAGGDIVTLGVQPDSPATGFGYIEPGTLAQTGTKTPIYHVRSFTEKPDCATAADYVARGFVWNAGMFVWKASTLRAAFAAHAPQLLPLVDAVSAAKRPAAVLRKLYPGLARISFDYAVMEKAHNVLVARGDFGWDDVGSWTAMGRHFEADEQLNIIHGSATMVDVRRSVIVAQGTHVALMGLDDIVVVSTRDNVLVAAKNRVQDLKKLVAKLGK